jgi:hypothetical protein
MSRLTETKKTLRFAKATRAVSIIAIAVTGTLGATASSWANTESDSPRAPRATTITAAERAELIEAAVKSSAGREASATERTMMNMSREESRAMMSKPRVESKSIGAQPVRMIQKGNVGMAVIGTALISKSSVVITKDGKHLHSCGPEAHTHDPAVQEKIEAAARTMAALKGGVRE